MEAIVCGIRDTVSPSESTPLTVKLVPSSVTDPFTAMYFSTLPGTDTFSSLAIPSAVTEATRPQASTCPVTICPPKRPPQSIARSRFTFDPGRRLPRDVLRRVSGMTEALKWPLPGDTVRQTPFTAMLSPSLVPSSTLEAPISRTAPSAPPVTDLTVPVSSIIPVNICIPPSRMQSGYCSVYRHHYPAATPLLRGTHAQGCPHRMGQRTRPPAEWHQPSY